jgi:MFS family permease
MFWAFNFGLGAPLASLRLQDAGCTAKVIGLNTSVYYSGIALAASVVPWMMRRWGRGCLVVGMLASAVTVAWFPWGGSLLGWFLLRLLNGVAGAMSLIPLETLVNRNAPPERRSRDFGYYAVSVALGMALGTGIGVPLYPLAPATAFVLGGVAALLAAATVFGWLEYPENMVEEHYERTPLAFGRNFLSFGSAWSQGFLEGGMVALMPVYLLAVGLSEAGTGALMGSIMIGVILSQVPLAWLADRLGRTAVLLACYAVTAAALGTLMWGVNLTGLACALFLAGACSGAFYPLGLAILGERVPSAGLPRASAWFLAINCIGSLIGPALTGAVMDEFGKHAMFAAGEGAVLVIVAGWLLLRVLDMSRRRSRKAEVVGESAEVGRKAA